MNYSFKALSLIMGCALGLTSLNILAEVSDVQANISKLHVPPGFKVEIYAEVPGARQMALGSNGNIYVGTRGKKVYAVVDKNKDRKADEVITILDDLNIGNGVAMYQGNLYVAEQNRIARYPAADFDLSLPFSQMREIIYDQLPDKFLHGWRYIAFGVDGKLYVSVGAPCNVCEPNGIEATILRMDPDGKNAEVFAKGVRNSVGLDFQPGTNTLYFTDNGIDMMGDDIPGDEFNAATRVGQHFGFPYISGKNSHPKEFEGKNAPQPVIAPVMEFQAHSANLGFKFYTGNQFPSTYKGSAIVAQHGSWNRSKAVGYQLIRVIFDSRNKVKSQEVFIDGWLNDGEAWGRPTDVLQLPDGSLLVSDDYAGVIYRVSYDKSKAVD